MLNWLFGDPKQARIDALAFEVSSAEDANKKLTADKGRALADLGNMTLERDNLRSDLDIALRRNAALENDNAQLAADVAGLLPDAERYRAQRAKAKLNLRQFQPAGAEARA